MCEVRDGQVVSVDGGDRATVLAADWERRNDPACYNVAELGIGLNPNARPRGVMLEDEGVRGTVHLGIGTALTLGGTVVAPTHYDLLVWHPVVTVDGRIVVDARDVLV